MSRTKRHSEIRAAIGHQSLKVLLVEGEDDKRFIESLLNGRSKNWQTSWLIDYAGGKNSVLKMLKEEPSWVALVDRDEWTEQEIQTKQSEYPNRLFVLPRFCMESYHIVPSELWDQLNTDHQKKVSGGFTAFSQAVLAPLDSWVTHGALWHAVNPLQESLQSIGFKDALLNHQFANAGDAAIQAKLKEWHDHLDPTRVMGLYRSNLSHASSLSAEDRLKMWVHGKRFFKEHVSSLIFSLTKIPQMKSDKLLQNLQLSLSLPEDLKTIWKDIGLP